MPVKKRFMALAVAGLAVALSVAGVVIAATDSNPADVAKDSLTLNGYPPHSADLYVTLSSGADFGLNANVNVNFKTNRVDAIVRVPIVFTTAAIEFRLIGGHLYARSADVSSGPWLDSSLKSLPLFGIALEMTKPDVKLITGFTTSVTKSGYSTTYSYYRNHVALVNLLDLSSPTSILGAVRWTITVGSQGELTKSTLAVTSKHDTTVLSATVLSYNDSVNVAEPSASNVQHLAFTQFHQLFASADVVSLLVPRDLLSLSSTSLT